MSKRSLAHEKRLSKYRVTDEDLFSYVLRTALLSYILTPKVPEAPNPEVREKEHLSRLQGALSSSIFSIGDLFKDGSKSVKFPDKLLKILEQKLQDIAMGKDPVYTDQLTRRTMAVLYGQFKNDTFKRQMKENRKIEELILMFATHATAVLKKEPSLVGDGWKIELNNQIAQFVKMLRECLRHVSYVSPELLARLDVYTTKLAPPQGANDSGYDSGSTSRDRDSLRLSSPPRANNIKDMSLVRIVGQTFKISDATLQNDVDQYMQFCTEKAALLDLKTCLKNINAGAPFPGRREDFQSEAAWQAWRTQETSLLSQLMLQMLKTNPGLTKSTSPDLIPSLQTTNARPTSSYSLRELDTPSRNDSIGSRRSFYDRLGFDFNSDGVGSGVEGDEEVPVGHHFTYIPPNPKKYYQRLVEFCLVTDLEKMLGPEVDDNEEVSLGILSSQHLDIIHECALRWRIGQPYRAVCFLDQVKQLYERNDVPFECVPEALQGVVKVMHDVDLEKWSIADSDYLAGVYGNLFNIFLSYLYHAADAFPNIKPAEIEPYITIISHVQGGGLLQRFDVDVAARLADIQERLRKVASGHYITKMEELQSAPGVNRALPLLLFTDDLEKSAKLLDKRFPEPILGQIDFVSIFVGVQMPLFIAEMEGYQKRLFDASMSGPSPDVPIQDIFALYRRVKLLMDMYAAFCPSGHLNFEIGAFFEPYVRQWLVNTDSKTGQWVANAIAADQFQAEGPEGHSSSIVDLFDSLRSPINFLQDLNWSDEYQNARFFTSLSKTISHAVEQYCRSLEDFFMTEMFPRPTEYLQPQKTSAWLEKARQLAITGEKKVEPFNFQPESCVKLNNVGAARKLLDNMYNQMQADKVAEIIEQHGPVPPDKVERPRFLFTVKIVIAEGLVPLDSSPSSKLDSFVTLSDENGNRLAKTRTVYETLNPRWDETFDISIEKPLWLMVSIRDRALIGKHDTVGREYICLDPRIYGDFLTHDVWKTLDTQGRILLRISMEGEKDDIHFYFGRAFRSLKRAESDMLRIFIDKMSPFIQQCLSRHVLKTFIKGASGLDYNKALGGVTALYRSAIGPSASEVQIPLPQSEKPRVKPDELTDVDIEQAILPLFDYFDANLQTLNTHLSEEAKEIVMGRIWKEVLTTIEGLLVPPLSDISSDMKPLSDKEVDVVFKWLKFLRDYFYAGGEGPVPLEILQNQKYRDIFSIRLYYDWTTDALMEECVRMMQQTLRNAPSFKKRAKSVYQQRNLGTIKERKKEKRQEKDTTSGETIMRILRMRPGTSDFIAHQLQIMATMQAEQEQRTRDAERQKLQRPQQNPLPPNPPLPGGL